MKKWKVLYCCLLSSLVVPIFWVTVNRSPILTKQFNKKLTNMKLEQRTRIRVKGTSSQLQTEIYKNPCWFSGEPSKDTITCLPSFYVPGFGKSGTSTLCRCISLLQDIAVPDTKELGFWDRHNRDDVEKRYLPLLKRASMEIFNYSVSTESQTSYHPKITYDCTPRYVWTIHDAHNTPQLIFNSTPEAKLIFIMRNPTDRLYSHYHHDQIRAHMPFSPANFSLNVQKSIQSFRLCQSRQSIEACVLRATGGMWLLKSSIYHFYIKAWMKVFPTKQMLFIKAEDFYNNTESVMKRVVKFLDLREPTADVQKEIEKLQYDYGQPGLSALLEDNHVFVNEMNWSQKHEVFQKARSGWTTYRDTISPEIRLLLDQFYEPHNKILAELLHDDRFLFQRK